MKRLAIAALFILAASIVSPLSADAYASPGKPTGYVNDFAGILSPDAESRIGAKLKAYQEATGNEIAVVTVSTLGGEAIEPYATALFAEWGIGKEKEDNGALLLVAPNDREARIEVGYGLEPYLTDAASWRIMNETLIPAFKKGNYEAGIEAGADRMLAALTGAPDPTKGKTDEFFDRFGAPALFALILLIRLIPFIIYSKSWWLGGIAGGVLGFIVLPSVATVLGMAAFGLVADYLLSKKFGGKGPGGMSGTWFGGFGGGSKGGGGFGGFGGGMSGGGGSSGRW